jgi:hypothetical protein
MIELIKASSPLIAAIISGACLVLVSRHKRMQEKLLTAYQDIQFLQAVELVHVEMTIGRGESDNKNRVRSIVRNELDIHNSGITPSQVKRNIDKYSKRFTMF